MTKEQDLAIKRMNRSLKALNDAGIRICGMNSSLLYATEEAINNCTNDADYCDTARAAQGNDEGTGQFKADCYEESGGW